MKRLLLIAFITLFAGAPAAHAGLAQQNVQLIPASQKVSIENGTVYVNGNRIDASDLPRGMRDLSADVNMTFWTMDSALIDINGNSFYFEEGAFRPANQNEKADRNVLVMFSSEDAGADVRLYEPASTVTGYMVESRAVNPEAMQQYVAQLREQANQFNKLTFELKEVAPETNELARRMVVEAENTARLASIFPRVEYEAYLGSLQSENRRLYEELMRERDMEMRTHRLAQAIQQSNSEQERAKHEQELRSILTEIFELKQANRRQEISQLETQLKELQGRLEERQSLKDDIIESRLNDLLNLHRW